MSKIPKIIHLCWLSGEPYPPLIAACIASWQRAMPDYKLMLWDARSFDLSCSEFAREAYEERKWAFASDYIRLWALYHYGGIYLDSDVYTFKSFDPLLENRAFSAIENCIEGNRFTVNIEAAVIGAEPKHPFIKDCLDYYQDRHFIQPDGTRDQTTLPKIIAGIAENKYDFRRVPEEQMLSGGIHIYSSRTIAHAHIETYSLKCVYALHMCDGGWYEKSRTPKLRRLATLLKRFIHRPVRTINLVRWNLRLRHLLENKHE